MLSCLLNLNQESRKHIYSFDAAVEHQLDTAPMNNDGQKSPTASDAKESAVMTANTIKVKVTYVEDSENVTRIKQMSIALEQLCAKLGVNDLRTKNKILI